MAAELPLHSAAPLNAFEVVRYVTDMATQLEAMAVAARLDNLAYFLAMAKMEGDLYARNAGQADHKGG